MYVACARYVIITIGSKLVLILTPAQNCSTWFVEAHLNDLQPLANHSVDEIIIHHT